MKGLVSLGLLLLFFTIPPGYTQQQPDEIAVLDSLGEYYFAREQLDSSAFYHRMALELAKRQSDRSAQLNAYNWLFVLHYYRGATDSMGMVLQKMTPLAGQLQPQSPKDFEILSSFWGYKSFYHYSRGELAQNIQAVRKALELYEQQTEIDTTELAIKYQNLGIALEEIGAFDQAHEYSRKALELLRPSPARLNIQEDSLTIITSLGVQMIRLKQYTKAEDFFQKGEKIAAGLQRSSGETISDQLALYHLQRGSNYYFLEDYRAAASSFQRAQQLLDRHASVSDLEPLLLRYRARNALARGDMKGANSYIRNARQLIQSHFPERLDQLAATQELLGEIEHTAGKYPAALNAYQEALISLCPDFQAEATRENPELASMSYAKNDLLRILRKKGESLSAAGRPEEAFPTFQLAVQLFRKLRGDFLTEASRLFLSEQTVPLFAAAIETAIELEMTEAAFQLVEQGKALLLQEGLKDEEAYAMAGVPDSLIGRIRELQIQQTYWERARYEAQIKSDSTTIQGAEDELFQINRERYALQEKIRSKYPDFFTIKFGTENIDFATLRHQLLSPGSALVEFFVSAQKIFLFGITPNEAVVRVIEQAELYPTTVHRVLDALQLDNKSAPEQYARDAFALYQQFLAPVLEGFQDSVSQLYIVPDGLFSYLPFEALLTTAPPENAYSTFPYLIKKVSCTYAYSSTLLLDTHKLQFDGEQALAGFAPEFGSAVPSIAQRSALGPLRHNIPAVEAIRELTGGMAYTREMASKNNLLVPAKIPMVLHLSTHARMNDQDPMASKIYLSDGDISTREIYHFPYSCRMVVLSACETGTGKYYKGEGMMSLARAFLQSGSPSVVTSLWRVDDRTTGELMVKFYQNLIDGKPKDEALREAKLEFLDEKESEMLHHPYYWAAFIHLGDPGAIEFSRPTAFWIWGVGIAVLLVLGTYLMQRKKSKK